jgi:surface protein
MSLGFYKKIVNKRVKNWERPSDWLEMQEPKDSNAFVGLYAIFPEGNNFASFSFTTTTGGQYRVYWGDEVPGAPSISTLHNSGTVAERTYDYNTISNSTLCSRGYKQVLILVAPEGEGGLTQCNFQLRRTTVPVQNQIYATGFLDCILSMSSANSGTSITFGGLTVRHSYCERFDIRSIGNCTSMANMFTNCHSLQSVPLFDTTSVTTMANMFTNCHSLQSVPLFDTTSVTTMNSMFNGCNSLESVPLFNTQNVTNMSLMFGSCSSLQSVPLFNTQNVTLMNNMFSSCSSLQSVPLFNTQNVTNMSLLFNGCSSLQSVPLFNTQNVTNMSEMFSNCSSLQSIPALSTTSITTTSGTDFSLFASGCSSLDNCQMVFTRAVNLSNCQLSKTTIEEIFTKLVANGNAVINILGNWGVDTAFTKTCNTTVSSTTISITDTSSLVVGMQVTGTGTPLTTGAPVSFTDSTDRVSNQLTTHGLQNGDEVSFSSISTTTGIVVYTIYYVRNATSNDFQLSATPSGAIINLVNNGSGTIRYKSVIVSITTNTNVIMSRQMGSSQTGTSLTFRVLQTGTALLKNWTAQA